MSVHCAGAYTLIGPLQTDGADAVTSRQTEESIMETIRDNYFTAYRSLKLTRDAEGVLVVQLHSNGGPLTFTAQAHTEVVDAFYRISQDRANKIVILTGAGGDFMIGVDWSSFENVSDPGACGARSMTKAFRFWKT
jgi:enoyl-CoA hydratase/carnithine racemase